MILMNEIYECDKSSRTIGRQDEINLDFSRTQTIMKDKWMNTGYEDDELKPYVEPELDLKETKRIGE